MIALQDEGKEIFLSIGEATYPIMLDSLPEKHVFISLVGEIKIIDVTEKIVQQSILKSNKRFKT